MILLYLFIRPSITIVYANTKGISMIRVYYEYATSIVRVPFTSIYEYSTSIIRVWYEYRNEYNYEYARVCN